MNTMEEILKNTHSLNEAEIDYHKNNYKQIKKEINTSETILRQNKEEAKEFIEQLNNLEKYGVSRDKDGKVVSRGLNQFLDTSKQRDLLVAIWVISQSGKQDLIQDWGIKIQNEETFEKMMVKISQETRRAAKELNKKSPTPEEVKKVKSGETPKETEEEPSSDDNESEEIDDGDEIDQSSDDSSEEEVRKEQPSSNEPEDDKEEEAKPERKGASLVDTNDFPPPKKVTDDFESFKDDKLKEIEDNFSFIGEPNKEQQSKYDHAKSKIDKIFSSYKAKIMNKQRQYDVHPTRSSAMKASTEAQKMASNARREANDTVSKFKRSSMPGRLERTGMRVRDAGRTIGKGVDAVKDSRAAKVTRDALKSGAAKGAEMAKSGAAKASEAGGKVIDRVKENMAAKAIEKYLGPEKRNEYVENLRKGNAEEAEKIRQEGIAKAKEERDGKQSVKRDERYDRMKSKSQQENFILRNYGKKLYELADNPATREEDDEEKKEDPKVAKTAVDIEKSIGANQAKEYMELSKSSDPKDLEKAASILQNLETRKKESEKKLGIEESNASLKRVLKSIMR